MGAAVFFGGVFFGVLRTGFFFTAGGLMIGATPEIASTSPVVSAAIVGAGVSAEPGAAEPAAAEPAAAEPDASDADGVVPADPVPETARDFASGDFDSAPAFADPVAGFCSALVADGGDVDADVDGLSSPMLATTRYAASPAATVTSARTIIFHLLVTGAGGGGAGLKSWLPTTTPPHRLISFCGLLPEGGIGRFFDGTTSWLTDSSIVESCPLSGRFFAIGTSLDGGRWAYHSRALAP